VAQRFQLVLQFDVKKPNDLEDLVRIEDMFRDVLGPKANVDGHDVGAGEFNFLFSRAPLRRRSSALRRYCLLTVLCESSRRPTASPRPKSL
jgi:hypothetical protein